MRKRFISECTVYKKTYNDNYLNLTDLDLAVSCETDTVKFPERNAYILEIPIDNSKIYIPVALEDLARMTFHKNLINLMRKKYISENVKAYMLANTLFEQYDNYYLIEDNNIKFYKSDGSKYVLYDLEQKTFRLKCFKSNKVQINEVL